jgi:hypothetical protein
MGGPGAMEPFPIFLRMNPAQAITLTPAGYEEVLRMAAAEIAARAMGDVNVDDLQMMDLSTCANFLGIPLERAAKVLPYVELGPRTRRVRIADFKAYQDEHMKRPKGSPQPLTLVKP